MAKSAKGESKPTASLGKKRNWRLGRILWGVGLLVFGIGLLLDRAGLISANYANLVMLWPLLLVLIGLSLLSFRSATLRLISLIVGLLVVISAVLAVYVVDPPSPAVSIDRQQVETTETAAKRLVVDIKSGAGTIDIDSAADGQAVSSQLTSQRFHLQQSSELSGEVQKVKLEVEGDQSWWTGGFDNELKVTIGDDLPTDLNVEAGASQIMADLSQLDIRQLTVKAGASDLNLRLGDRAERLEAQIDAGASAIKLEVPRSVGLRIEVEGGMSSHQLDGLNQVNDTTYQSDGYDQAERVIRIKAKVGLSSLELKRY